VISPSRDDVLGGGSPTHRWTNVMPHIWSISIHDATPRCLPQLRRLFDCVMDIPVTCRSVAIVPNWDLQWDVRAHPDFIEFMKELETGGWELVLHGYSHSHPKRTPIYNRIFRVRQGWEFYGLNYAESTTLLTKGLQAFREAFASEPKGFVAPNWHLSPEGERALRDLGFSYTTYMNRIENFDTGSLYIPAVWFGIGKRPMVNRINRAIQKRRWRKPYRLVLHPGDRLSFDGTNLRVDLHSRL